MPVMDEDGFISHIYNMNMKKLKFKFMICFIKMVFGFGALMVSIRNHGELIDVTI